MPDKPHPWISISSGALTAEIDPHGAQLSTLRDAAGVDLLWNGDPAVWTGRAPLLFPIVGVLAGGRYRLGSTCYPLSRHGFARVSTFALAERSASTASFTLEADAASLAVYPFEFELHVRFELQGSALTVSTAVRNHGSNPMPASVGYHPALRWPLPFGQPRAAHFIEFAQEETAPVRRIDSAGLLTAERHPTPIVARRLALEDSLFRDDVVILDRVASRSVIYGAEAGARIQLRFPDAPYLGIWTKPGAHFICIEPWHGITDVVGFSGDFKDKEGVFIVPPGGALSTNMTIALLQP